MKKIKLFATDCDGCLTDGGMYYDELGNEWKKFNARDGMGFSLLRTNNIITAIITSENTNIVTRRAKKLKIDELHQGVTKKIDVIEELRKKYNLDYEEIAYVGDDINDIEVIKNVGLSFTPANGMDAVKKQVKIVLSNNGGDGAIREAINYIIESYNQ